MTSTNECLSLIELCAPVRQQSARLTSTERAALARLPELVSPALHDRMREDLARLIDPIETAFRGRASGLARTCRNQVLLETHRRGSAYWSWDEDVWTTFALSATNGKRSAGLVHLPALGYLLAGHRRLHHRVELKMLSPLAGFVFGAGAIDAAINDVTSTLARWQIDRRQDPVRVALVDVLISNGSPHLKDITLELLQELVEANPSGHRNRRGGLFTLSRVLADTGLISAPLITNYDKSRPWPSTLDSVPQPWRDYAMRGETSQRGNRPPPGRCSPAS